ncbi:organic solute transporter Ostalpha-domain-containing protein [Panaeolus papilionaceus]|nr:organic solute transporter Ostalpha-domain-containing protein [Panaeolus papilionaceus]
MTCDTSLNTVDVDQSDFWDTNGIHWDAHRIGWAIAGGTALLTIIISFFSILGHCRNYTKPAQQRQILRILYMPPIYAIISFFSYRFFRDYTYYSFIQIAYEAITLSAFLLLIIEYVAETATGHSAEKAVERKDKMPLPIPFCCWRYRPTKAVAYFMYTVKWSVLQYVIIRPAASIAGIICEKYEVLCHSDGYTWRHASLYIEAVNFISISIALYGLLVFYGLMHNELVGRRPMAKFLSIKLIVMFTFYQSFVFGWLEGRVIHETQYWTTANIANGLNALAICIEMVLFSGLMWWAYTWHEYRRPEGTRPTSIWRPLWDSVNLMDFVMEIVGSLRFYFGSNKRNPASRAPRPSEEGYKMNFGQAFGLESETTPLQVDNKERAPRTSSSEALHNPYRPSQDDIPMHAYPGTARLDHRA